MFKQAKKLYYSSGAALTAGMILSSSSAHAAATNNFSTITTNITKSVQDIPALLTILSYLFGILLGVLGVMKIKDHVENPSNTPLKDGAIRLAAGGALFALPLLFESMLNTIGADKTGVQAAQLSKATVTLK